ncbi:MAG: ABC transporter ATP-binding protein [Streptosporangiaceae bacterium]
MSDVQVQAAPDIPELVVDDVTVRFAGVTALDHVSFRVEPGTIHAVIGPNGAGKSTCFNVICGVYRAEEGAVRLGDRQLSGLRPHRVAALGIGRTFQNIALSRRQTVLENLMLGRHHITRAGFVSTGLRLPGARRERHRAEARIREIAEFLELGDKLHQDGGLLAYGDQKRVEMARALAMEPSVLLLDEPVAGMSADETRRMAVAITAVREALGISILLVEHDMGLVMNISERVTVLDFGQRIAEGRPAEVQHNAHVIRAYLGSAGQVSEAGERARREARASSSPTTHPPSDRFREAER